MFHWIHFFGQIADYLCMFWAFLLSCHLMCLNFSFQNRAQACWPNNNALCSRTHDDKIIKIKFCVFLGSAKVGMSKQEKVKKFIWRTIFLLTIRSDLDEHWSDGPNINLGPSNNILYFFQKILLSGERTIENFKKYSRPESCYKVIADRTRWTKLIPCCANCANPSHSLSLHSPDAEAPMFTIPCMALWFKFQLRCFFQNKIPNDAHGSRRNPSENG